MLSRFSTLFLLILSGLFVTSCKTTANQLVLPAGSAERGQLLFSTLHCTECHSVGIKYHGQEGKTLACHTFYLVGR
jgi:cytochrome c551/c552